MTPGPHLGIHCGTTAADQSWCMYYNQSIKEPGDQVEEDDEISQENPLEEVKRVLLNDESDSAKKTIDDSDLGIKQNPKLYMEIQERMEEITDPNEEGIINRMDSIRTRLLQYFEFYDCHNSENRTSDNKATAGGLDDEVDEDAEEDSSTTSFEDPDVAAKDAPNLHEYYRKYKKAAERNSKKTKLNFELEVFMKDLDYLVMLACKTDAKTPPWMDYEYLVDGKLFEFFELFLPYLSRYLSTSQINGTDNVEMETKIALRLKDVFEYTCSLSSAREVYTYTMANIEIYRKSVIFPMLLQIIRRSLTRLDYFKRQKIWS